MWFSSRRRRSRSITGDATAGTVIQPTDQIGDQEAAAGWDDFVPTLNDVDAVVAASDLYRAGVEIWTLAVIVIVVFVAAVFQASVGFGANVIAQPIVFLLEPSLVPGSILLANVLLSCLVMFRDRQGIDQRPATGAVLGVVAGAVVGVATIRAASPDVLAIVIAGCVLLMVALLASNSLSLEPSSRNITLAALVGGFAGTTAGIGGPPMALVYQRVEGANLRGSLAGYFVIASPVALVGLAIAGRLGWREVGIGFGLFPVVLLAFVASGRLLPIVDRGFTRPAILSASALAAIVLIIRTIAT